MTYSQFLLVFLVVPLVVLGVAWGKRVHKRHVKAGLTVCLLAYAYTSPWDNHAARAGLWSFDPRFAPPSHFIAALPWEEYAFYGLQGLLVCLLSVGLSRWLRPTGGGAL